ncbi:MAG: hypothetical protein C0397_09880 [Odoribacter sp.]|nr:hypothetical protein [Odoribacter sp.]
MKKIINLLILFALLFLNSCSSTKKMTAEVPREQAKFDYTPQSQAGIGSSKMSIVLVRPVFISANPEYLVSPFPEMASSMGNDFEELLTAKGFTIRGPFNSRDEMVFNDKVNSSFILEVQIDLRPQYSVELSAHNNTSIVASLLFSEPTLYTYSTKGAITFGGNLILTALSPQYGEKIWKKSIALKETTFPYVGTKTYFSSPDMASQLREDNQVYNTVSKELQKFYNYSLDMVSKQIDPEEMKIVTKQAKEADSKGN